LGLRDFILKNHFPIIPVHHFLESKCLQIRRSYLVHKRHDSMTSVPYQGTFIFISPRVTFHSYYLLDFWKNLRLILELHQSKVFSKTTYIFLFSSKAKEFSPSKGIKVQVKLPSKLIVQSTYIPSRPNVKGILSNLWEPSDLQGYLILYNI
jgi:hypothetical protein